MTWNPTTGHVPRGYFGATGEIHEVELVLVFAEPGDPHGRESYRPSDAVEETSSYTASCFKDGTDYFHRNMRMILDWCWPNLTFDEQMRKTWVTESVLCSAVVETGPVPAKVWRACRDAYLDKQLDLFDNAVVVALGSKAAQRLKGRAFIRATSAAPPGCNHKGARESWQKIAEAVNARHA